MRIIVHCNEPVDCQYATPSVEASIRDGHERCGYRFANVFTFVTRNRTGWTVRVERERR